MPHRNKLYYGDNFTVLRDHVRDCSVDLVYLDPPFNSRADYNVLFAEKDGTQSTSQITAFEDTWEWNLDAEHAYQHVVEGGGQVADAMRLPRHLPKSPNSHHRRNVRRLQHPIPAHA